MSHFDDRTVTLDALDQLAELGSVLGSRTRLAVLAALVRANEPLHINELARRVGVDASPVRTHLELLLKARLVHEVDTPSGRERRFETSLTNVRLVLEDLHKPKLPAKELSKPAVRIQRRIEALMKDMARLEEKGRKLHAELKKAAEAGDGKKPQKESARS